MPRMSRSTDNDPLLGRVLDGRYTLQSVLGRGGMGVVYRAYQKSLERPVALKLMRGFADEKDDEEREAEFQRRFFLEAATAAKLKHPNTITVFDYGSTVIDDERAFFITMELLEGVTLSKLLQDLGGALPSLRAVHIALQICRSLREAHAAGIVHRDLKPGNVMLIAPDDDDEDSGDFVKVLDFGLAKTKTGSVTPGQQLTKAGTFLGSPRYVAPEQIESGPVDGRADIYALGCVLYRMLCGRVPFDGEQPAEVMLKHVNDPVPSLRRDGLILPVGLEQLVLRCLEKKAVDRPRSMDDVIAELKRARGELGGIFSGNITIPEDVRERLRAQMLASGEGAPVAAAPKTTASSRPAPRPRAAVGASSTSPSSLSASSPSASSPSASSPSSPSQSSPSYAPSHPPSSSSPSRSSPSHPPSSSSPSQSSPSPSQSSPSHPASSSSPSASSPSASSPSASSPSASSPSLSAARTSSGEWQFRDREESSLSSRPGRDAAAPPRKPWAAVATGVVLGLAIALVFVAEHTGALEEFLEQLLSPPEPASAPLAWKGPRATEATAARLSIKTTPASADVFEVTAEGTRLVGLTPLTLPWDVAVGDPGREFLLKKAGFVPSRARVDPPPAAPNGATVWLDVEATLRSLPPASR